MLRVFLILLTTIGLRPALADTPVLEVIVARGDTAIEVFVEAPADQLVDIFGVDPASLRGLNTGVDFTILSDGTWDQGDAILAKTRVTMGDEAAPIEAMSMMVHPTPQKAAFVTPIDGAIAISVCGVEPPAVPPPLSDLTVYVGYNIFPVDGADALEMRFPITQSVRVNVKDYDARGGLSFASVSLALGDALRLETPETPSSGLLYWVLFGGFACAVAGGVFAFRRNSGAAHLARPS